MSTSRVSWTVGDLLAPDRSILRLVDSVETGAKNRVRPWSKGFRGPQGEQIMLTESALSEVKIYAPLIR